MSLVPGGSEILYPSKELPGSDIGEILVVRICFPFKTNTTICNIMRILDLSVAQQ